MQVLVGLDVGTTSTKAVTAGADARVRDVAKAAYPLLVPAPGRAELDAVRLQEAAVEALAGAVAAAVARGDEVVGVSLCTAMHGLAPADADGRPLGPLVTWADQRAASQAAALHATGRAQGLHRRTGTPVHAMSPLVKLAWHREQDPEAFGAVPRWSGAKELLLAALCGGPHVVDLSLASATGAYDLLGRRWDEEALEVAGVRVDRLPEVVPTTTVLRLRPDVARRVGLPAGLPVVVGASDGVLANLGTGAVADGTVAVSVGTSGALRRVVPRPSYDPRLFCYALTEDRWVLGGAVNNGGSVVRWAALALSREQDAAEDAGARDARLLAEAGQVGAGSDGLLCLPYLLGERAPWWEPGLRGAYVGLRREHGRPHLVRAAVEGVCQQLALVLDALDQPVHEVRATGGALASPLWAQVLASALDLPVRLADSPEGTGLGAVLLGLHALGELPDLEAGAARVLVREAVEPVPADAARYRRTRPLVQQAVAALTDVLRALEQETL